MWGVPGVCPVHPKCVQPNADPPKTPPRIFPHTTNLGHQAIKKATCLPQGLLQVMVALHDALFLLAGVDGEALQAAIAKVGALGFLWLGLGLVDGWTGV